MSPAATSCGTLTRAEIAAMRSQGIAVSEIASLAGVARTTMYNALSAWGLVGQRGGDHRSRAWREGFHARLSETISGGAR